MSATQQRESTDPNLGALTVKKSRMQPKRQSTESGLTLTEVVVSMIVLGIVLAGLAQALTYGIKVNNQSKLRVANLNACKYVMENLKTQISQSQAVFDGTNPLDTTYYVDSDGNKTYSGTGANQVEAFTSSSAFRVRTVVSNSALTQTVAGVATVLVKAIDVTVVDILNRDKSGREVEMKVEVIRPST